MKNKSRFKIAELSLGEVILVNGGCEIQDPDHGKPKTLWEKIWDIISK